jgi:hypothetical protein
VLLRTLSFDLAQTPVARGEAVAIVGESARRGLSGDLCWTPLVPPLTLAVVLLARLHNRPPAAGRLLDAAPAVAGKLGWVRSDGDADPR